jgi:ectoine hydroxylase-related dioxygenase (phytanoyl-CoA dioxygenase family)
MTTAVASFDRPGDEAVHTYERDGVVCLRQAISAEWLAVIEQGISEALSGGSADLDVVQIKGDAGRFSYSSQAWRQVAPFRRFIFESPLPDLCWPFLRSETLTLFYDFLLIKEAGSNSASTPWHQDQAYYPLQGRKIINCWTALDSIPLETALRFHKGSHAEGALYRATNFSNAAQDYKHARHERSPIPDIDNDPDAEILSVAMEPGDMLVWNGRTFHSAPGNTLGQRRAAFSVNWTGDDVRYEAVPSLETYRDPALNTGDRIEGETFPLVRAHS